MKIKLIILIVSIASFKDAFARESLSCRNEEGVAVDWFIIYKLPYLQKDPHRLLKTGFSYAYISGPPISKSQKSQPGWTLSNKLITSDDSIIARTLDPLFKDKSYYSHLMYSDAPPVNSLGKLH